MNLRNQRFDRLVSSLTEIYKQHLSSDLVVSLVPLEDPDMYFPGLAICVRMKQDKQDAKPDVGYHVVLIEGEDIPPLPLRVETQTFEIPRPPSAVFDAHYESLTQDILKKVFPDTPLHSGVARVLTREFKFDNEKAVYELASDCALAATSALHDAIEPNQFESNLRDMHRDATLSLVIDRRPMFTQSHDKMGSPVRADLNIRLMMQRNERSPVQAARMLCLTDVKGFFDVVALPDHQFLARFVITSLDEDSMNSGMVWQQLLALASLTVLSEAERWRDEFIAILASGGDEMLPGVKWIFGDDVDLGNVTDVKKRMDTLFRRGLVFSMEVGDASSSSWRHDIFAAAAQMNSNAVSKIISVANALTGDRFRTRFQIGMPLTISEDTIIPIGHWVKNGVTHSLQDIDQIFVASQMHPEDNKVWRTFSLRRDIPNEIRFARQCATMKTIVGPIRYTDQGKRFSFGREFLTALARGLSDAGLRVRLAAPDVPEADYTLPTVMGGAPEVKKPEAQPYHSGLFGGSFSGHSYHAMRGARRWE